MDNEDLFINSLVRVKHVSLIEPEETERPLTQMHKSKGCSALKECRFRASIQNGPS